MVLLVLRIYVEVLPHISSKRKLWRFEELLLQMGRFYFILWAFLLEHLVLVLKKVLGRHRPSSQEVTR